VRTAMACRLVLSCICLCGVEFLMSIAMPPWAIPFTSSAGM